jgi:hypothetical protein
MTQKERGRKMKKQGAIFFVIFLVSVVMALNLAWGQEKNLAVNNKVTATIKAFDREYLKGFNVYSAGVLDAPTALLFDIKDDFHLPSPLWGKPLSEAEIIYAIHSLDEQHKDNNLIPFPPRALNIVNLKGKVLGYVYTGLDAVLMDRKKEGSVTVYPPNQEPLIPRS